MLKPPCKGCERRTAHPNCHSTCQQYKDFVQDRQKYRDERRKNCLLVEYIKDASKRW